MPSPLQPLRAFVRDFAELIESRSSEPEIRAEGALLLAQLIANDDWLPEAFATPDPDRYRQYLLHCDSRERFSVVSFVWAPGQSTPVHDHTVWGLIGVLRGAELSQRYGWEDGRLKLAGPAVRLERGAVDAVSPAIGDIHRVSNARSDRPSVSIHVYGANIGAVRRSVFDAEGRRNPFVSSYSNSLLPNVWAE